MEGRAELDGRDLPVRIEIDHPTRFDERVVGAIDFALDGFHRTDELSRQVIQESLTRPGSAPSKLLERWGDPASDDEPDVEEFLRLLVPIATTILPDGGGENLERVQMVYALSDASAPGRITVRFRQGSWPEADPRLS